MSDNRNFVTFVTAVFRNFEVGEFELTNNKCISIFSDDVQFIFNMDQAKGEVRLGQIPLNASSVPEFSLQLRVRLFFILMYMYHLTQLLLKKYWSFNTITIINNHSWIFCRGLCGLGCIEGKNKLFKMFLSLYYAVKGQIQACNPPFSPLNFQSMGCHQLKKEYFWIYPAIVKMVFVTMKLTNQTQLQNACELAYN